MKILIFHGYLLRGTGSNIYNANLARALVKLGHDVHLICQEDRPEQLDYVQAVVDLGAEETTRVEVRSETGYSGSCTVYRPDIGTVLPVYVADSYERFEALTFDRLSEEQLGSYLKANIAVVGRLVRELRPDIALANHEIMGPVILARALGGRVPYAVKIHGSALEYTVRPHRQRFLPYMVEGLTGASKILVGSHHMAERLFEVIGDRSFEAKTALGPPGVDVGLFQPQPRPAAVNNLQQLHAELGLEGSISESDRLVVFVGKYIVSKGVDLLLAAWPQILSREPEAKLLLVGFGTYERGLRQLVTALATDNQVLLRDVVDQGRALEGGEAEPLHYLGAFLDRLDSDGRQSYFEAAKVVREHVIFVDRLEHDQLTQLLPACEAMVVPSTFPEAFGMVAVEAAACGVWPIVANHSGLAEVADQLAEQVGSSSRELLRFDIGESAVEEIAATVGGWLELADEERRRLAAGVRSVAEAEWSWQGVAEKITGIATVGTNR